ncbi:hypothetical protein [uncultured Duncaniella sp.]|uniref:hypothetical protein n=1 Tax=uncultured Duncaniella sp. TaxID=2768039 RepID=UPI0025A9678B|nr:hypothetical protein [uncultured Duncaniella sp.]
MAGATRGHPRHISFFPTILLLPHPPLPRKTNPAECTPSADTALSHQNRKQPRPDNPRDQPACKIYLKPRRTSPNSIPAELKKNEFA